MDNDEVEKVLALVRGLNATAVLVRELGISASMLNDLVQQAADEDRELTVADLEPLKQEAYRSRNSLAAAIDEARKRDEAQTD